MVRDLRTAFLALNRFGFGARGGMAHDLSNAASDPRAFVKSDIERSNQVLPESTSLLPTHELSTRFLIYSRSVERARHSEAETAQASSSSNRPSTGVDHNVAKSLTSTARTGGLASDLKPIDNQPNVILETFHAEVLARVRHATMVDCGFAERLVAFWSNHFSISIAKNEFVHILAGAFEREAIRPHILGHFADMVLAVERHAAMLLYLDNNGSIGPNSRAGLNRHGGINENFAREILELHTLGIGGGYTQSDVTSLSKILTGWAPAGRSGKLGAFEFNLAAHEPGPKTLLSTIYEDKGIEQGKAALRDIARHPSTARSIAFKFARHFVADEPPPVLVAHLQEVFNETNGDLKAMSLALIDSDASWLAPPTKIRLPYEYVIATARALSRVPDDQGVYLGYLGMLGQPLWTPPGPNGFPDTNPAWIGPEQMKLRLDIASQMASSLDDDIDPRELLDIVIGPAASSETRQAIGRAASRQQAVTLLLMSPEFQRR